MGSTGLDQRAQKTRSRTGFFDLNGVPRGSRTPVTAVKGRCPGPLDDGDTNRLCRSPARPMQMTVKSGGARRDRTADLLHAMQALSQLSYGPGTTATKPQPTANFTRAPGGCQLAAGRAESGLERILTRSNGCFWRYCRGTESEPRACCRHSDIVCSGFFAGRGQ